MRIISGRFKSRKIFSHIVNDSCTRLNTGRFRPTTDMAKETLFNVLNNIIDFNKLKCLDLFAGSGSLGFEAISRGADSCDFVDISRKQTALITKTADALGCSDSISVYNTDALEFLKHLQATGNSFYDLIFADPPYDYQDYSKLLDTVMKSGFSVFVLEYSLPLNLHYDICRYEVRDKRTGKTNFKIFISKDT
jgi:16S rRNA (guanine966-N2)-methyltransferase